MCDKGGMIKTGRRFSTLCPKTATVVMVAVVVGA